MGGKQSTVSERAAYEKAGMTIQHAQTIEQEEKEDHLRDEECSWCRFIPVRPDPKTHGVSWFCMYPLCPNSPKNKFFHSHYWFKYFGNVGFHFLDKHRNIFFGLASFVSLAGVALLVFGATALAMDKTTVVNTHWAKVSATNVTSKLNFKVYVGLQALVYEKCLPPPTGCKSSIIDYSDTELCNSGGLFGTVCSTCSAAASKEASSVAFSAITKGIAIFSMQKRMYGYADSPSLKLIGILSELAGAISLGSGLGYFNAACLAGVGQEFTSAKIPALKDIKISGGYGYWAFLAGLLASLVRGLLHLLTPLPRKGKGLLLPMANCICKAFARDGCCELYDDDLEEDNHRKEIEKVKAIKEEVASADPEAISSAVGIKHTA